MADSSGGTREALPPALDAYSTRRQAQTRVEATVVVKFMTAADSMSGRNSLGELLGSSHELERLAGSLRAQTYRGGFGPGARHSDNHGDVRTYGSADRDDQLAALEDSFGAWGPGEDGAALVDRRRRGMSHRLSATNG
jgi:hypothetical protein